MRVNVGKWSVAIVGFVIASAIGAPAQTGNSYSRWNSRYHLAQIVWEDIPSRVRFYRNCLEFKQKWGTWGVPECKALDKELDQAVKRLAWEACEAKPETAGKCASKLK
jgi:hypothetical protein